MPNWFQRGIRLFKGHKKSSSSSQLADDEIHDSSANLPNFHSKDLRSATENYSDSNLLAEGEWGKIYKGRLANGCFIAVKLLLLKSAFEIEKYILSHLQHPNVIRLFGYCNEDKQFMLVYELMENGSLDLYLFSEFKHREVHDFKVDWKTRWKICLGVAKSIHYIHEESGYNIIHRDIKASNVLLDKNFNPKLTDFSTARPLSDWLEGDVYYTQVYGTGGYMAPETRDGHLTSKVDVYSFGILLIEITSGLSNKDLSFDAEKKVRTLKRTGNLLDLVDAGLEKNYTVEEAEKLLNLSIMCTESDPSKRPDMSLVIRILEGKEKFLGSSSNGSNEPIVGSASITCSPSQGQEEKVQFVQNRTSTGNDDSLVGNTIDTDSHGFDHPLTESEKKLEFEVDYVDPLFGDLEKLLRDLTNMPIAPSDNCDNYSVRPEMYKPFEELKTLVLSMNFKETLFVEKKLQLLQLCEGLQCSDHVSMEERLISDQIKSFVDGISKLSSAVKVQAEQSFYLAKYDSVKEKVESTKTEAKKFQVRASALRASIANSNKRTELLLSEIAKLQAELDDLGRKKTDEENELRDIGKTVASSIREVPPLARWLTTEFNQRREAESKLHQAIKCLDKGEAEWDSIQKRFN